MRYKVQGADKATGKDIETTVQANTPESAREAANMQNILVASISVAADPTPKEAPPKLSTSQPVDRTSSLAELKTQRETEIAQTRAEAADPVYSYLLLQEIEKHTRRTAFWVWLWSVLAVIGIVIQLILLISRA